MVSIGIEVATVKPWFNVILIQSLSVTLVDTWVVLSQPIAISHFPCPVLINQLEEKKHTSNTLSKLHLHKRPADSTVKINM